MKRRWRRAGLVVLSLLLVLGSGVGSADASIIRVQAAGSVGAGPPGTSIVSCLPLVRSIQWGQTSVGLVRGRPARRQVVYARTRYEYFEVSSRRWRVAGYGTWNREAYRYNGRAVIRQGNAPANVAVGVFYRVKLQVRWTSRGTRIGSATYLFGAGQYFGDGVNPWCYFSS